MASMSASDSSGPQRGMFSGGVGPFGSFLPARLPFRIRSRIEWYFPRTTSKSGTGGESSRASIRTPRFSWSRTALTSSGAIGGVVLFLSAMAFVSVVIATWTSGRKIEAPAFEFAVPLEPVTTLGLWDRLGLWTIVGIVMIILAYGYPLATLIMTPRFGSPPFQPF